MWITATVVRADTSALNTYLYDNFGLLWDDDIAVVVDFSNKTNRILFCDSFITEEDKQDSELLSVVGPYVSYEYQYWHSGNGPEGPPHPAWGRYFRAFDIRTNSNVSLLDFYDEKVILNALLKDKFIQRMIKGRKFNTLKELFTSTRMDYDIEDEIDVEFSEGSLSSFAFHHIKDSKVAIRIGLDRSSGPYWKSDFQQVGIYLPIPEKLKDDLLRADQNKTLMKYLEKEAEK